jgi:hypothetical protein
MALGGVDDPLHTELLSLDNQLAPNDLVAVV